MPLLATELLSGYAALISTGSPNEAVRASAAIPGIFPPTWVGGRWLIDGALASCSGVAHAGHAAHLGATQVYVLPTGVPCALRQTPRSALGTAVHALTLLIEQRFITEVPKHRGGSPSISSRLYARWRYRQPTSVRSPTSSIELNTPALGGSRKAELSCPDQPGSSLHDHEATGRMGRRAEARQSRVGVELRRKNSTPTLNPDSEFATWLVIDVTPVEWSS